MSEEESTNDGQDGESEQLNGDQVEWANDLHENLMKSRAAAHLMMEKLEALLNEEITIDEYEEWTEENKEVLAAIEV